MELFILHVCIVTNADSSAVQMHWCVCIFTRYPVPPSLCVSTTEESSANSLQYIMFVVFLGHIVKSLSLVSSCYPFYSWSASRRSPCSWLPFYVTFHLICLPCSKWYLSLVRQFTYQDIDLIHCRHFHRI